MRKYRTDCRLFTGYRPCIHGGVCEGCPHFQEIDLNVLLINLDALGDVLRTTALLPAIRRQFPNARISWLTRPRAVPLLENNPDIDRIFPLGIESDIVLRSMHFDVVLNVDKSITAGAIAMQVNADERRGFGVDSGGAITPLNSEASLLYDLGLNDADKFFGNQRTVPDLVAEALGFVHHRDGYTLNLRGPSVGPSRKVGINTGCGPKWPYKKLDLKLAAQAVRQVAELTNEPVLLLGGPEDVQDHRVLAQDLGEQVEATPLDEGLLAGAAHMNRCDVVISGDSLGMHMAIALSKHVVAWFGPTSPQEIDLYDRGVKLLADVDCAPCWKPHCERVEPCRERVSPDWIAQAVSDCLVSRQDGAPINAVRGRRWEPRPGGY